MTEEQKRKALEAGFILSSEVFREVFASLDARYVKAWRVSGSQADRDDSWFMQRALAEVKKQLLSLLHDADVATKGKDKNIRAALKAAKQEEK